MTRLRITRRTGALPTHRRLGERFKQPKFKAPGFGKPGYREYPTMEMGGRPVIRANQVRDIGRAGTDLEAELVNAQVSAEKNPEVWEEVDPERILNWESTTSTSGISRITRMKKFVTTTLGRWRQKE